MRYAIVTAEGDSWEVWSTHPTHARAEAALVELRDAGVAKAKLVRL